MSTFIVTGASSGIGRAAASALAGRGASVLAVARSAELLAEFAALHGEGVRALVADLATDDGVARLVDAAFDLAGISGAESSGRIDGIVHAAGSLVPVEPYGELDPDELTRHFRIHVATPIEINGRLGEALRGGRVVYIDSYSASDPRDGWSGYSIVKAGAQMAARAAAQELDGVDVVRVFPGGVRTPLVEAVLAAPSSSPAANTFRSYDAAGELTEPSEIGAFIAHVMLDVERSALAERPFWDFSDPDTHPK